MQAAVMRIGLQREVSETGISFAKQELKLISF